jgi:hypothetical protein
MAESVIGRPMSDDVYQQILQRQSKISSPQRDNNILFFLNSNNAWVKLTSGANTLSEEEVGIIEEFQSLQGIEGDSTLAQNTILGQSQNKSGISTELYSGPDIKNGIIVSSGDINNSLYRNTNSRGFRPISAIQGVRVKSKGTYGTLRETEVKFIVWSLEDLDIVEAMYLRPGFSMLLEWGHTAYFTTDGEFRTASSTVSDFFTKYTSQEGKSSQQIVQDKIQALREESNYNYDALFGYVKNFSWSFRKDGGYDCTISIASAGSLIEGLRADVGLQNIPEDLIDKEDAETLKNSLKSSFHYIFEQLTSKQVANTKSTIQYFRGLQKPEWRPISQFFKKLNELSTAFIYQKQVTNSSFLGQSITSKKAYFLHLSTVFDIINTYITLKSQDGKTVEIYSGNQDQNNTAVVNPLYDIESKYATSKYHFSIDPFRVHLPFPCEVPSGILASISKEEAEPVKKYLGRIPTRVDSVIVGPLGNSGISRSEYVFSDIFELPRGEVDDILNILVSSIVLEEIFDRNLEEPNSQKRDMLSILDNLASILTDNLGGVNEFAFHFDETRNLFILVDRKNTPTEKGEITYPRLALTGLKSTVDSVSLSSRLSNKVGTQIAIAAQGSGDNYQENISELLKWNRGIIDRHGVGGTFNTEEKSTSINSDSEEYNRRVKWFKTAADVYKTNGSDDKYDPSAFSELKAYHRIYTSNYVLDELIAQGEAEKGIIPVELSFTMLGISGIDIAESFKIEPGILPTRYSDKFGFIITGLEHEIGSKWKTTFRTQFYILQQPSEKLISGKKAFLNPKPPTTEGFVNSFTGETGTQKLSEVNPFSGPTPNADFLRSVLKSLGYLEKNLELSSGGDISAESAKLGAAVARRLKEVLPGSVLTFTSGNDAYHQNLTYISRHTLGRGLDFVVSNPNKETFKIIDSELDRFVLANDPNVRYINEYKTATAAATAGHYHISWGAGTEALDTLLRVRKLGGVGVVSPVYKIS